MVEDLRGHLAELLAKAIDRKALEGEVPKDELDAVRRFLAPYANVGADGVYRPTGRSGFAVEGGGYLKPAVPLPPLGVKELAPSGAVVLPYMFEHIPNMQSTMLQPVGAWIVSFTPSTIR